jgi:hypothetical protein
LKEWKMSTEISAVLEEKITSALANGRIGSVELRELIPETEAAHAAAEATAQAEREKALDPVASPDSAKAERSVWAAEFTRDRLRSSLTHLHQRLGEVEAAERQHDWQEDYEAVKAKRDARAREFAELYPSLTAQLLDLFRRAEAVDEECSRVNAEAPQGEHRRLLGVELTARKLESFSIADPSVIDVVKLPDWSHSDRMIWPPPKIPLSVLVAASISRFSSDWAAAREKDKARRSANEAR